MTSGGTVQGEHANPLRLRQDVDGEVFIPHEDNKSDTLISENHAFTFQRNGRSLIHSLNKISWQSRVGEVMFVKLEPAMQKGITLVTPRSTAAVKFRFLSNTLIANTLSQ
ncbi:hypothetical protein T10_11803 [Trichinella papuae]|uniref:Uncharacterized protein n=1 Tax=Trichinella papuae TaxID=268474 RepID=A0A0V1MKQ2_9BILA|nr:hypothetical protein T10_11803 [Trichinella papuae]